MIKLNFEEIGEEYFKEERREPADPSHIYVRDVTACLRRKWYGRNIRKNFSSSTYGVFDLGNTIEDKVADILKWADEEKGYLKLKRREKPMMFMGDGFVLSGRLDFLVEIEDVPFIIECKSKSSWGFRNLEQADKNHIEQLNTYLKTPWAKDGFVLYASKGNLMLKGFSFTFDEEMFEKTMKKAEYLSACLKNNKLPMRRFEKTDGEECKYCEYKEECKKDLKHSVDEKPNLKG